MDDLAQARAAVAAGREAARVLGSIEPVLDVDAEDDFIDTAELSAALALACHASGVLALAAAGSGNVELIRGADVGVAEALRALERVRAERGLSPS